ncbi:MAG: choline/ethanolamine kinase family protein [Dehalococcoidia bacterium]
MPDQPPREDEQSRAHHEVRAAIEALPSSLAIDPAAATVTTLKGLTNRNYLIDCGDRSYVLRLAGPATGRYIDRTREAAHARAAHAAGIAPALFFADPETGTMLTEYLPLAPVTGDAIRNDPAQQRRCALALRRLHALSPPFEGRFDPFEHIDRYLAVLAALDGAPPAELGAVQRAVEPLRALVATASVRSCHVDTYCENFLDDGRRTLMIDWEYSGTGDPVWDLANLSRENALDAQAGAELLRAYAGTQPAPELRARFELYKPLCDLFWAAWCLVQVAAGNDTGDWALSARRRLAAAEGALGSAQFGALLATATAPPQR